MSGEARDEEVERRLRDALLTRADEVGHPPADGAALRRRRLARVRRRRRGGAALALVVGAAVVVGGLTWDGPSSDRGERVRASVTDQPERGGAGPACPLPAGAPGAVLGLDLPGTGLVQAVTSEGSITADPEPSVRAVTVYSDPGRHPAEALSITVAPPPDEGVVLGPGDEVVLADGQATVVTTDGPVVRQRWQRDDGLVVTVAGLRVAAGEVAAAAEEAQSAVDAAGVAPVALATGPADLPLLAAGTTGAVRMWTNTWGDGVDLVLRALTILQPPASWPDLAATQLGQPGVRWVEVGGRPALLTSRPGGFDLVWERDDGAVLIVDSTGIAVDRWEEVVATACGVAQDEWPGWVSWGDEEGPRWRPDGVTSEVEPRSATTRATPPSPATADPPSPAGQPSPTDPPATATADPSTTTAGPAAPSG